VTGARHLHAVNFKAVVLGVLFEVRGAPVADLDWQAAPHGLEQQRQLRHVRWSIGRLHVHREPRAWRPDLDPVVAIGGVGQREPQTRNTARFRLEHADIADSFCHGVPPFVGASFVRLR
jgi:hypothetical protein